MPKSKTGGGKSKAIVGDLIYSVAGLICMNGVLQLFLYPFLEKRMGTEAFGNVITLLAVISVLATTFGSGANYARMVAGTKEHGKNGDFNLFLLVASALSGVIAAALVPVIAGRQSAFYLAGMVLLTVLSILRYYGDVEYRLHVNFRGFFVYYLLISLGYAAGTLLFPVTGSWILAVLPGELACLVLVTVRGGIFRGPGILSPSPYFAENLRSILLLSGTNLINALVLHSDKLLLRMTVSADAVTVFYVATLVGKIVALLTTPLNGVIIGYLSRYKGRFTARFFSAALAVAAAGCLVFTGACLLVSHLFVRVMYPTVYETAKSFFLAANAGQILYFISGSLMVVVLRFTDEKYQLMINTAYAVLFALIVIPSVSFYGLWGITFGLLAVNVLRFALVTAVGYRGCRKKNGAGESGTTGESEAAEKSEAAGESESR